MSQKRLIYTVTGSRHDSSPSSGGPLFETGGHIFSLFGKILSEVI